MKQKCKNNEKRNKNSRFSNNKTTKKKPKAPTSPPLSKQPIEPHPQDLKGKILFFFLETQNHTIAMAHPSVGPTKQEMEQVFSRLRSQPANKVSAKMCVLKCVQLSQCSESDGGKGLFNIRSELERCQRCKNQQGSFFYFQEYDVTFLLVGKGWWVHIPAG